MYIGCFFHGIVQASWTSAGAKSTDSIYPLKQRLLAMEDGEEQGQPLPLQLIGRWYPLLLEAGSQQDVQDLATLYTLATTFTLVLCDSIAGSTYGQQEQQQRQQRQQQLEGAPLSILRLCLLRQQLAILGQIRRAVRTSQVWHALLLDHLHRVRRDFEVTQRMVAAGRLFSAMLAFFGAVTLSTSSSSSLAIAALASLVLGLCTGLVSTIGHSIHLSLPLFRIEDSTRTMRSVAIEAEIGSLAVLHTLITIEQCVESLQIEARFLVDSLCFSLHSSGAPEMTTSVEQFGRYAIGWEALVDQIGILSGRVQRARRRWERQGSARRRYHRLRSLLS